MSTEKVAGNDASISFLADQVLIIDPRSQGFGLKGYDFLDSYANDKVDVVIFAPDSERLVAMLEVLKS